MHTHTPRLTYKQTHFHYNYYLIVNKQHSNNEEKKSRLQQCFGLDGIQQTTANNIPWCYLSSCLWQLNTVAERLVIIQQE